MLFFTLLVLFFFFKQKTAYEMRISDWSSDVCSSDLVEGAYSLICMTPEGMIACRDPLGIRPLVMGKLGDATIFASETVAFDVVGAEYVRSIEPGELVL